MSGVQQMMMAVSGSGVAALTYDQEVLADSPLAFWKLEETSGTTANDSSGNSRNGTYTGGCTLNQTGLLTKNPGKSVLLDGSSGYVNIGVVTALIPSSTFMVEAVIKLVALPASGIQMFVSGFGYNGSTLKQPYYFRFFNRPAATLELHIGAFSVVSGVLDGSCIIDASAITTGVVYHLVAGYDGAAWRIYINAVLQTPLSSDNTDGAQPITSDIMSLGAANDGATVANFLNGYLQKEAIYTGWLGVTRIAAHYNAGF